MTKLLLSLLILGSNSPISPRELPMMSIMDFGDRADGSSDDYEAFRAAAEAACKVDGTTLVFPPGHYRIGRYRITAGSNQNQVEHIVYRNCHGTKFVGYGAHIHTEGRFFRTADYVVGSLASSYSEGVIPFAMLDSSEFSISGFDLDGGVADTTRDSRVTESTTAGIYTTRCRDYLLKDLEIHHFATDGITLGGSSTVADRNAQVLNVSSHNNGRQALSVIQLAGGQFFQSRFYETGRTGIYGFHPPAAGVDVEPVRRPPEEDVETGDLLFEACSFSNNVGSQFVSAWPDRVHTVTVRSSRIEAWRSDSEAAAFMNSASVAVMQDNDFLFSGHHGVVFIPDGLRKHTKVSVVIFKNNHFRIDDPEALHSPAEASPVTFTNNKIDYYSREPRSIHLQNLQEVSDNLFQVHCSDRKWNIPVVTSHDVSKILNNVEQFVEACHSFDGPLASISH